MKSDKSLKQLANERTARRVKTLRKLLGMKQQGFAALMAVNHSQIELIESGNRPITAEFMLLLNMVTGVSPGWLSGEKGDDDIPLSMFGEILVPEKAEQSASTNGSQDVATKGQQRAIHSELLEWTRVFHAAAKEGKFTALMVKSIDARLTAARNAALGASIKKRGVIQTPKWPPSMREGLKSSDPGDQFEDLCSKLESVLSPMLLLEIGKAFDEKLFMTPYIGMLQSAIQSLQELEQIRRRIPR